jgi:cytochrome P450
MNSPTDPIDPISAVTHPDPYPFYAGLVARRPLYRDDALRLWVASSAEAVTAVLTSDLCRVRPPAEPVPQALLGSPAAEIFRHLVRMNDGPGHCPFKQAVGAALDGLDAARIAAESRRWAGALDSQDLAGFAFRLPVTVVAGLLGVPEDELDQTVRWMRSFVPALAPGCSPEVLEEGKAAAGYLIDFFRTVRGEGLLTTLSREARRFGRDDDSVIIANGIGLLFQAHDATAGLIGNTLVALASHREVYEQVTADPKLLADAVLETLRFDPPVQNTRRFVARDGIVAGQAMQEGDAILVVLAAANRDLSINPHPDRFDLFRKDRKLFTFGAGVHACPGERLATMIARAGIERILRTGIDLERFAAARAYRPSVNARIPFGEASTASARR